MTRTSGPAILIQDVSTVVVEPGCTATVSPFGDVAIDVGDIAGGGDGGNSSGGRRRVKLELDPVYLSIFAHRFMGIAEQMGRTLQVCMYVVFFCGGVVGFSSLLEGPGVRAAFVWPAYRGESDMHLCGCCRHRCAVRTCCLYLPVYACALVVPACLC